jgi:hypothetical protein
MYYTRTQLDGSNFLCMYMCIYVYIYIHVYIYICIYIVIYMYSHIYTYACIAHIHSLMDPTFFPCIFVYTYIYTCSCEWWFKWKQIMIIIIKIMIIIIISTGIIFNDDDSYNFSSTCITHVHSLMDQTFLPWMHINIIKFILE